MYQICLFDVLSIIIQFEDLARCLLDFYPMCGFTQSL